MNKWKPTYIYATYDEYLSMCAYLPQIWGADFFPDMMICSAKLQYDAIDEYKNGEKRVRLIDDSKTTKSVHLSKVDHIEVRIIK